MNKNILGDFQICISVPLRVKLRLDLSVNDESIEALCVEIVKKKQNKKKTNTRVNTDYKQPVGHIKQCKPYYTLKTTYKKRNMQVNQFIFKAARRKMFKSLIST